MFARALIVLLVILNLGVALWWLTRSPPSTPPAIAQPAGVPRLQLLSEGVTRSKPTVAALPKPAPPPPQTASTSPAPPPTTTTVPTEAPAPATPRSLIAQRCLSFGPFVNADAADRASERLRPQVLRVISRQTDAQWWLDVAAGDDFDVYAAQRLVASPQAQARACSTQ